MSERRRGPQAVFVMAALFAGNHAARACDSLNECLSKFRTVARGEAGISSDEADFAATVRRFGASAVEPVLSLLRDGDPGVRALAGFTLRDMNGLGPEHLDRMIDAMRQGNGWIPPAIARVGGDKAIRSLIDELRQHPDAYGQVAFALELLGASAAPYLVNLFDCSANCDSQLLPAAAYVLRELKQNATSAVEPLIAIAADRKRTLSARIHALHALRSMETYAIRAVPALLVVRRDEPRLCEQVNEAIVSIGAPEAAPLLVDALPRDPQSILPSIGRLGSNGVMAGPSVASYLKDPAMDLRVEAATTLGYIGYAPGSQELIAALEDENDWQLVAAASNALGALYAISAVADLQRVGESYWYPPVRQLAMEAVQRIRMGAAGPTKRWVPDTSDFPVTNCGKYNEVEASKPQPGRLNAASAPNELKKLSYPTKIGTLDFAKSSKPGKRCGIRTMADSVAPKYREVTQVPQVALKVDAGWLVGSSRGEWGGELVHIGPDGTRAIIYDGNITDLFSFNGVVVAVAGLSHMGLSRGMLVRAQKGKSGLWGASEWKRLPGAPGGARLTTADEIVIDTDGGRVVLDRVGALRMAKCVEFGGPDLVKTIGPLEREDQFLQKAETSVCQ